MVGLIENLEPPGDDLKEEVELIGDEERSVLTTWSGILVGLILKRPEEGMEENAGDFAKEVSLTEASSAKLLSSAKECEEPDGFRIPFKRGRSIEHRLNPYNRKISAGFLGTESYTKS